MRSSELLRFLIAYSSAEIQWIYLICPESIISFVTDR